MGRRHFRFKRLRRERVLYVDSSESHLFNKSYTTMIIQLDKQSLPSISGSFAIVSVSVGDN